MSRWPRDNQSDLLAFYGTPGPEVERQLVPVVPPFTMYYDGRPVRAIQFHRKAASALLAALNDIWEHYGHNQATIDQLGISKYAGAYNPRKIRGSTTKWSNHAYGAAIDLNAEQNGFNTGHGNMPQPVIDAFKRQGFRWGGDYRGRTDPMHFEACDAGGAPVGFADLPQTDGDTAEQDAPPQTSTDEKPGFFRRTWRHAVGWSSGVGGLSFLGYMTEWQVVAILCAFVFLAAASVVGFTIWFFGAERVREWVRRQVG